MSRTETDNSGKTTSINLHHYMNQTMRKTLSTGKNKTHIILLNEKYKGRKNKRGQNKRNEEYGTDRKQKTTAKVYDLNSYKELNGYFRTAYHENESDNDNE